MNGFSCVATNCSESVSASSKFIVIVAVAYTKATTFKPLKPKCTCNSFLEKEINQIERT